MGQVNCPNCGRKTIGSASVCLACGRELPREIPREERKVRFSAIPDEPSDISDTYHNHQNPHRQPEPYPINTPPQNAPPPQYNTNQPPPPQYSPPQYPPPQYPPPYAPPPYPYPYPNPYVQPMSHYGPLYSLPPRRPRLRFDLLLKVLVQPKEAFQLLYLQTTKTQGLVMAVLLSLLTAVLTALVLWFSVTDPFGIMFKINLVLIPLTVIMSLISVYGTGWLSAKLSNGRKDIDKTVGLVGYGSIVSFVMSLVSLGLISLLSVVEGSYNGATCMSYMISIAGFIWAVYVNGHAVSVANDISVGSGMGCYFIAAIILMIIVFGLTFMVSLMMIIAFGIGMGL